MLQRCQLTLSLVLSLLLMQPFTGFAVEEFKVSENGKGEQMPVEKVGYSIGSTSVVLVERPETGGLSDGSLIRATT